MLQPELEKRRKADGKAGGPSRSKKSKQKPAIPHGAERPGQHLGKDRPIRRKKGKRRKGGFFNTLGKVFDDFDDIGEVFEDMLDIFD